MAERIEPFIHSSDRLDLLADLARTHSDRTFKAISTLIERNIEIDPNHKKDGKDGGKDAGEGGFWDKKDGKDGKDKEKDGKESKEGKEGKESKDGKDSKDGKEGKEGKESKDGKEGKESKEGGKEDSKDGKDKDGKDKDNDGSKITGAEGEVFRYGLEVSLPANALRRIAEIHNVRLTALLNQPIF
jgi:hypothetical protein